MYHPNGSISVSLCSSTPSHTHKALHAPVKFYTKSQIKISNNHHRTRFGNIPRGVVVHYLYMSRVVYILFLCILLLHIKYTKDIRPGDDQTHIPNHFLCIFHSIDFFLAVGRYMYLKSRATPNWRHNRRGATQTKNTFSHQIIIIIILYAARMRRYPYISMLHVLDVMRVIFPYHGHENV